MVCFCSSGGTWKANGGVSVHRQLVSVPPLVAPRAEDSNKWMGK
jgi:hypothetical protein